MEPLVEPVPESRLADVLLGELCPRPEADDTYVDIILEDLELVEPDDDDDDYALFQVVRDPFATTEFVRVRDTSRDHVVTVKFPRGVLEDETAEIPQVSAPYERIEIETIIVAEGADVAPPNESRVPGRIARGTDASSIVAQSVPETAARAPGRLARGTDASSLVAQSVPEPARAADALPAEAPQVSTPYERIEIETIIVAEGAELAPRAADEPGVAGRIGRGTDASTIVVAPSVQDMAPRGADASRVTDPLARAPRASTIVGVGVPGVLARGVLAPRVVVPRAVVPRVVAKVPDVAPRGADMADGIDVWFDDAPESDEVDPMPDILDVWLDEAPSGVGAEPREESGARFMAYANALPFPLNSAPFERVELGELPAVAPAWPDDATDVLVPRRSTTTRVILTTVVLACAFALALGLAVLVMRAST